jgi:hypothetical protein
MGGQYYAEMWLFVAVRNEDWLARARSANGIPNSCLGIPSSIKCHLTDRDMRNRTPQKFCPSASCLAKQNPPNQSSQKSSLFVRTAPAHHHTHRKFFSPSSVPQQRVIALGGWNFQKTVGLRFDTKTIWRAAQHRTHSL